MSPTGCRPSPEKSRYRHVGFGKFSVSENPVSQDLLYGYKEELRIGRLGKPLLLSIILSISLAV